MPPISIKDLRSRLEYRNGELYWIPSTWRKREKRAGYRNPSGYIILMFSGKKVSAHRATWALKTGKWPSKNKVIDHINGITWDNRIENLRLVTHSENLFNSHRHRSGKIGTSKDVRGRWRAIAPKKYLNKNDDTKPYLGSFKTRAEAQASVDRFCNNYKKRRFK